MINITLGLIALMLANIMLGLSLSIFDRSFEYSTLLKGLLKIIFISIGLLLIYFAGYLNPNIIVVNINNINLNLMDGVKYIFVMGIVYYGYQDLVKVLDILKIKVNIKEGNIIIDEGGNNGETIIPR